MPTPTWLAATSGQPTQAGQVNQFLGAHAATLIYNGVAIANHTTLGSGSVNSNGLYVAQKFTTGASPTTLGRFTLGIGVTGAPPPLTVGLYANSGSAPSGAPLATVQIPHDPFGASVAFLSVPLVFSPLAASTTYWLVVLPVGDASDFYTFYKSNQTSGASTSVNGTAWTAQTYGIGFYAVDQSISGPVNNTWEDGGARWTTFAYNANGTVSAIVEFTEGQTATGYLFSNRTLSYTAGQLAGIA